MKKVGALLAVVLCSFPAFAQGGGAAGKAMGNGIRLATQSDLALAVAKKMGQLPASSSGLAAKYIRIVNFRDVPLVQFHLPVSLVTDLETTARLLPQAEVSQILIPQFPSGKYTHKMFVPQNFLDKGKNFYRGMFLSNIDDLKNLLVNGLELGKSRDFPDEIYVTSDALFPLVYATPNDDEIAHLPVLIKIPATLSLQRYAPEVFEDQNREVFMRNVPAHFISDIWGFLAVNGKPDWYKVVLENDALVFIPASGQFRPWSAGVKKEKK